MVKFAATAGGSGTVMKQRGWAFLVIFLVSGCFVVNQVQAEINSEDLEEKSLLIELNEDNWHDMLKGEWMVEFFAPWCPACKNLAPIWERFASTADDMNVKVAKIDVTTSPSLSGRFFVTALPTIYHVKNGEFRQYRNSRDVDSLMFFLGQKQWSKLQPLSAWKKPDTLHMSVLSYFFKLSHTLKDFNGRLQEEYGLPNWASYALFALGTIFVGAGLGLMLVCVVDFLYPPKKSQRQSFSESKENGDNGIEDMAQDEIEDDEAENEDDDDKEDAPEDQEDDEDDEDNEDEDNEDAASTDDEKQQTQSESEEPESEKKPQQQPEPESEKKPQQQPEPEKKESADNTKPSPTEVRKRKPRKAD